MKRIMIVLACLTLILCAAASASAQGLPDLNTSSGLRVLLAAQKIMNKQGKMVVKNVSEEVKEIFEVTGFCDILTLE